MDDVAHGAEALTRVVATVDTPMRGGDLALLTVGGLLMASAVRQAQRTAIAKTRYDVMRHFHGARRRSANAWSFIGVLIGGGVVAYVLARIGRDLLQEVRGEDELREPAVPADA